MIGARRAAFLSRSYAQKLLAIAPANLVSYLKLDEGVGTMLYDSSGHNYNGFGIGLDLGQPGVVDGGPAPLWDGVNDYIQHYTMDFANAFNPLEGTISIWIKVASTAVWTDATARYLYRYAVDTNNQVVAFRSTTNGRIDVRYTSGSVTQAIAITGMTGVTTWIHICQTWSKSADQMIAYRNGIQFGVPQTGLGNWFGVLSDNTTLVGAGTWVPPANVWSGSLAHLAIWNVALPAIDVARLAVRNG